MGGDLTRCGVRSAAKFVVAPGVENDIRYHTVQSIRPGSAEG
jgi:hypothetical protein